MEIVERLEAAREKEIFAPYLSSDKAFRREFPEFVSPEPEEALSIYNSLKPRTAVELLESCRLFLKENLGLSKNPSLIAVHEYLCNHSFFQTGPAELLLLIEAAEENIPASLIKYPPVMIHSALELYKSNIEREVINYLYFIKDPSHNTEEDVLAVTFYEELLEQFPKEQHRLILQMLSLGYKQREIMQYANCSQPQISRIKNKIEKVISNF